MSPVMNRDISRGDTQAKQAKESFQALLQIAFDLPYRQRQPEYNRYYLQQDLKRSPGAWADANRHHRMRTWLMMSVLWSDYNQPLTYQLGGMATMLRLPRKTPHCYRNGHPKEPCTI